MNDRDALLDQRDDLVAATRNLYDALQAARPYVVEAVEPARGGVPVADFARGHRVLEAVDGALADAGELLKEVRS